MTKRIEGAKRGRPSLYSQELAEKIATMLSEGMTLKQITDKPEMPAMRTVTDWALEKPDFRLILMRARAAQVETLAGMMWEEALGADEDSVRTAQLRINTIQWLLARYDPKRFSERVLAEMAKIPEPVKEPEPEVDTAYLTFEERETFKQLIMLANARKNGTLIEHQAGEDEDDGNDGADGEDDQSGDPASGR